MNKKTFMQNLLPRVTFILVLVFCSTLFININSLSHVSAKGSEVKASLKKEYKFGIGTMNRLDIANTKDSAQYIYKSSDTSIISIFKDEYFDCKKYGTATLTVYEKYKGKKTKIGTTKVHVVKAQFREKYMTIRITDDPFNDSPIEYRVEHAPYKYFSADKSILEVDENTGVLIG